MWSANNPVQFKQGGFAGRLRCKDIQGGAADFSGFDGIHQIRFIHNTTAGAIDDHDSIFHLIKSGFVQKPEGVFQFWHMNGNVIGNLIQGFQ